MFPVDFRANQNCYSVFLCTTFCRVLAPKNQVSRNLMLGQGVAAELSGLRLTVYLQRFRAIIGRSARIVDDLVFLDRYPHLDIGE